MDSPTSGEAGTTPRYTIFRNTHGIPQFEPKRGTQALKDALIYAFPTLETELQLMQAALRKFFDGERGSRSVFELPERDLQTGLARGKDSPTDLEKLQPATTALRNFNFAVGLRTPSRSSWRSSTRPSSRGSSRASSRTSSRMSSRAESPYYSQEPTESGGGIMTTWSLASGQELEKRRRQPYDPAKRRRVAENRGNACERHRAAKTSCDPNSCPQNKLYGKMAQDLRTRQGSLTSQAESSVVNTPTREDLMEMDASGDTTEDAMDFDDQESTLSLDNTSTTLSSNGWDDQSSGTAPWSSLDSYLPIIEQPTGYENSLYPTQVMSTGIQTDQSNSQALESQNYKYSSQVPLQTSFGSSALPTIPQANEQDLLQAYTEQMEQPFKCNADPFMGWANRQASRAVDDYGWVLSHVGSL